METSSASGVSDPDAMHPALAALRAAGMPVERVAQALAFYDEPHRAYHSREHVREMLDQAVELGLSLSAAQAMAVLFHDAVYVPGAPRGDNETMSAQLLRVYAVDVDVQVVDLAYQIVIDTSDHVPRHPESAVVLDLDLLRLAAPRAAFKRMSREVFDEVRPLICANDDDVAWDLFVQRRVAFFQKLLERDYIFCLPMMRERYEATARTNIHESIAWVSSARGVPRV